MYNSAPTAFNATQNEHIKYCILNSPVYSTEYLVSQNKMIVYDYGDISSNADRLNGPLFDYHTLSDVKFIFFSSVFPNPLSLYFLSWNLFLSHSFTPMLSKDVDKSFLTSFVLFIVLVFLIFLCLEQFLKLFSVGKEVTRVTFVPFYCQGFFFFCWRIGWINSIPHY